MATLAESFLADLDDLSDVSDQEEGAGQDNGEDEEMNDVKIEDLNYDNLEAVAHLKGSTRYQDIMQRVRAVLDKPDTEDNAETCCRLLVDCNQLAVDVDNEIAVIHNFMRDKYRLKFPELESLVHHPIDYARVIQAIGNEMDITMVNLEEILPQATIMVVTVTGSTTSGKPLSEETLAKTLDAATTALQLDEDKALILRLVQTKMHKIAPNLSEAVGTEVAARLMGVAGGLVHLSKIPACNVQVLGAKRKNLAGYSTASVQPHQGFVFQSDIVQQTPPAFRKKAAKVVGSKCTLLARMDAYGQDPSGGAGQQMKEAIKKVIAKWQEPAPAKQTRVLPVPDMEPKKRRGGRRLRKMRERYGLTDVRKAANRMNFNQPEEEYMDGEDTVGLGMLGKEGSGRLRVAAREQKQKMSAKTAKKYAKQAGYKSGLQTSGLASLAFTPVQQGLNDQEANDALLKSGTESYFSEYGGFKSVKSQPRM
eukprot:jgi/Astpho2/8708/e_gw1.00128.13.1_t